MTEKYEPKPEQHKPLWQDVQAMENDLFPELSTNESEVIEAEGSNYYYFKPSYFFKREFITQQDIETLKERGRKILSVGSGPAYLERMLTKLGVPAENISLSDVTAKDFPSDFRTHVFDMHSNWPQLEEGPFDFVIIPEAFAVSVPESKRAEPHPPWFIAHMLQEVILKALPHLKPNGELRIIDPSFNNEVMTNLRQNFPPSSASITFKDNTILIVKNETAPNNE